MKHSVRSISQMTISPCINPFSLKFFLVQLFIIFVSYTLYIYYGWRKSAYRFLTNVLNCSPRSSIFLNRSKLAQHGLNRTVSPGRAILVHASMHSFMLCVSYMGKPMEPKELCSFVLSAPRKTSAVHFCFTKSFMLS